MQARPQSVEAKFEPTKSSTQGAANSIFAYLEWNEAEKAWIADIEPPVVTEAIRKMGIDQADGDIFRRLTRASIFQHSTMHAWPNSYASKPASFLEQYANIKSDPANPLEKKIHISHKEFGEAVNAIARSAERKLTYIYYALRDNKIFLPMAGQEAPCSKSNSFLFKRRVEHKTLITLKIADDRASYEISHKNYGEITIDNFAQFKKEAWEKLGFYFTDDSKKIVPLLTNREERNAHIIKKVLPKRKASTKNTSNTPAAASNDIAIASNGNSYAIASQQLGLAIAVGSNSYAAVNNSGAVAAVNSSNISTQHNNQAEQAKPKRQKVTHKFTNIPRAKSDEAHLLLNMFSSPQTSESKRDKTQPLTALAPSMPMGALPWPQPFMPQQLIGTVQYPMLHQPHAIPAKDVTMTDAAAVPQPAPYVNAFSLFRPTNQTAIAPQTTTASTFITPSPIGQGGST